MMCDGVKLNKIAGKSPICTAKCGRALSQYQAVGPITKKEDPGDLSTICFLPFVSCGRSIRKYNGHDITIRGQSK